MDLNDKKAMKFREKCKKLKLLKEKKQMKISRKNEKFTFENIFEKRHGTLTPEY